jgi:hypothetical protein
LSRSYGVRRPFVVHSGVVCMPWDVPWSRRMAMIRRRGMEIHGMGCSVAFEFVVDAQIAR